LVRDVGDGGEESFVLLNYRHVFKNGIEVFKTKATFPNGDCRIDLDTKISISRFFQQLEDPANPGMQLELPTLESLLKLEVRLIMKLFKTSKRYYGLPGFRGFLLNHLYLNVVKVYCYM
jgi:hypothetical protein